MRTIRHLVALLVALLRAAPHDGWQSLAVLRRLVSTLLERWRRLDDLHSLRDVLLVRGTWVFDTAHEGWNEIHPIKHCQRILDVPGGVLMGWPADVEARVRAWCRAATDATSMATTTQQSRPEHQWTVHPEVAGCQPADGHGDGDADPPH